MSSVWSSGRSSVAISGTQSSPRRVREDISRNQSSVAISGTQSSPHRQVRLVRVHAAEHERCSVRRRALGVDAADRAVPVGCDGRRSEHVHARGNQGGRGVADRAVPFPKGPGHAERDGDVRAGGGDRARVGLGGRGLHTQRGERWDAVVSTCMQGQVIRCTQRTCSRSACAWKPAQFWKL